MKNKTLIVSIAVAMFAAVLLGAVVVTSTADASNNPAAPDKSAMVLNATAAATPTIAGNPLSIWVGDENSFQVVNTSVPGAGQIFPTDLMSPADMGVFVQIPPGPGGTLYAPNFTAHGGTATGSLGAYTPWTPVSMTVVSASSPFQVEVISTAGALRLRMLVTYANTDIFFRHSFEFTNTGGTPITFDVYLGSDDYLANSDAGIPYQCHHSVGGTDCNPPNTYHILHIPVSPVSADRYAAEGFNTVWTEIGSDNPLSNTVASGAGCVDNGAALQWQNRTLGPGASLTIDAATSFGDCPPIANPIPTLSEWGAIIFGTLLLASVAFYIWRRRRAVTA